VGATRYVPSVKESFAVFDKTTGAILPGFPKLGNTSPNPIAGGSGSSTLSVSTGRAASGTYTLTITGAGGSSTRQTTVSLKIH
jgi:hypothetical protein